MEKVLDVGGGKQEVVVLSPQASRSLGLEVMKCDHYISPSCVLLTPMHPRGNFEVDTDYQVFSNSRSGAELSHSL